MPITATLTAGVTALSLLKFLLESAMLVKKVRDDRVRQPGYRG